MQNEQSTQTFNLVPVGLPAVASAQAMAGRFETQFMRACVHD